MLTTTAPDFGGRRRPGGVAGGQASDTGRQFGRTLQARGHWFETSCAHLAYSAKRPLGEPVTAGSSRR